MAIAFLFWVIGTISTASFAQKLKPGDGVRVTFLDITDSISGDYYILPDGKLQLPFVGIINTGGREFPEIQSEIIGRYDSLYRDPQLTVSALFRINILGEVRTPGLYYVTEEHTMTGLLALANGTTTDADIDDVYILREGQRIELDVEEIMSEGNTVADIGLISGDQVYVPKTWWASNREITIITSALGLVVAIVALLVRN